VLRSNLGLLNRNLLSQRQIHAWAVFAVPIWEPARLTFVNLLSLLGRLFETPRVRVAHDPGAGVVALHGKDNHNQPPAAALANDERRPVWWIAKSAVRRERSAAGGVTHAGNVASACGATMARAAKRMSDDAEASSCDALATTQNVRAERDGRATPAASDGGA
jgi:hypothetical protein